MDKIRIIFRKNSSDKRFDRKITVGARNYFFFFLVFFSMEKAGLFVLLLRFENDGSIHDSLLRVVIKLILINFSQRWNFSKLKFTFILSLFIWDGGSVWIINEKYFLILFKHNCHNVLINKILITFIKKYLVVFNEKNYSNAFFAYWYITYTIKLIIRIKILLNALNFEY